MKKPGNSKVFWPVQRVVLRDVGSVRPNDSNPRTHTPDQIEQVASSIKQWGWTNPVLIDDAGVLLAGHCRLAAAVSLGLKQIPAMIAENWSEDQKRAYMIADNKLALNAGWDIKVLAGEIDDLTMAGFDMALLGFSRDDMTRLQMDLDRIVLRDISQDEQLTEANRMQPLAAGEVQFSLVMAADARKVVQQAIMIMKERRSYETSAEALVGICNEWLAATEVKN